jgi:hypothetical protein
LEIEKPHPEGCGRNNKKVIINELIGCKLDD